MITKVKIKKSAFLYIKNTTQLIFEYIDERDILSAELEVENLKDFLENIDCEFIEEETK